MAVSFGRAVDCEIRRPVVCFWEPGVSGRPSLNRLRTIASAENRSAGWVHLTVGDTAARALIASFVYLNTRLVDVDLGAVAVSARR